jgi:hypothetical protein
VDQHRLVGRAVGEGGQAGLDGEGASRAAGGRRPAGKALQRRFQHRAGVRIRHDHKLLRAAVQQGFDRPAQHGFPAKTRAIAWPGRGPARVPEPAATMTAEKVMRAV